MRGNKMSELNKAEELFDFEIYMLYGQYLSAYDSPFLTEIRELCKQNEYIAEMIKKLHIFAL